MRWAHARTCARLPRVTTRVARRRIDEPDGAGRCVTGSHEPQRTTAAGSGPRRTAMNPADNHKQDTAAPDEALRIVGIDAPRGRAAQVKATSGHSRGDGPTAMLHLVDIATVAKCLGVNVRHVRRLVA